MGIRGRHISPETRAALARAIVEKTYGTATKAAHALGVSQETAYRLKAELLSLGLSAMEAGGPAPEPAPEERHDAAFWRRKAAALSKEADGLHSLVRELGGLDGLQIRKPEWMWSGPGGRKGRSVVVVHNSDRHYGEVVLAKEINGWNRYDPEVCELRVRRFMNAACEIGLRWTEDTTCDGVLYTMAGDEISGDIHEELRETNALTSLEQVEGAAELHCGCIAQLLQVYPRVHVAAVPGNHGRTTRKPTAKKYGALSYDILVAKQVAKAFQDDPRVSFQIADGPDVVEPVYNRPILISHGDKMGTGGGQGFAGRVLPIIRGGHKVRLQYAGKGGAPYLILQGHWHTSAAPPGILSNGSVVGLSEYGFGLRGEADMPQQWLAVLHSRWGLRDRLDVQLEEPPQPDKPRVRVSAEAVRG